MAMDEYDFSFAAEEVDDLFKTYSAAEIKELLAKIPQLEAELDSLEQRVSALEGN